MNLLERGAFLDRIQSAASAAADGGGSVLAISGEAGIGKTALVNAFVATLGSDTLVLRGGCDDLIASAAFRPLQEALGDLYTLPADSGPGGTLAALMELTAGPSSAVLVVEDLHWADDSTLDALQYLVRRIDRYSLLLVLTYRDDELGIRSPLRPLLGALNSAPTLRLKLASLSPVAVASLASGTRWDADELFTLTGGNPFFLTEALASSDTVPAGVVELVLSRMRGLDRDGLELLEQLAVIPTSVDRQLIAGLLGDRDRALEEVERRGLLNGFGDGVSFRHEIARRAVEQATSKLQRRRLNQNVVRLLLEDARPELPQLLHHAVEAGDTETLLRFAPLAAAEATNAGAHRQAVIALEAVLPHLERLQTAEQADVLDNYASELYLAGRFLEAIDADRRALALREVLGNPAGLATTLLRQARQVNITDDLNAAERALERAAQVAVAASLPASVAEAESMAGIILVTRGATTEALPVLESAGRTAKASDRYDVVVISLCFRGIARIMEADPGGMTDVRESVALAIATGEHLSAARAYGNLAEASYRSHHWEGLTDWLDRGTEFASRHGYWSSVVLIDVYRAQLALRRGDWVAAERRLSQLTSTTDESTQPHAYSRATLGRLLARRGQPEAEAILHETWQRAAGIGSAVALADAGTAYAEWAWLNDRPDIAQAIRDTVLGLPGGNAALFSELRHYLARAGTPLPAPGHAPLVDGFALAEAGSHAEAAAYWLQLGDPYERALALANAGDTANRRTALRILDQLGATAASEKLRRDRNGPRIRTNPTNTSDLTDRQLVVLAALTRGGTNQEIAADLGLSVRTVEHHVAAVLRKLQVDNRRAAVAAARNLGIGSYPASGNGSNSC
ncbi:AAA family ATPase [Kribbella sp. NBC_01505]|uniref:ATP-binding protein n=1 Tax=Kribbella sp. NBC_01505 TaxID=2903580 RepID=UPI0038668602